MIKFTSKQQEALRLMCDAQFKSILLYGGAQSAKTYVGLFSILIRAMKYPNSVHAICRLRLVDLRASILLNKFPEVVKHRFGDASIDRTEFHYVYSYPSYVKFSNGSTIFFLGLEDNKGFDKILAPSYTTVMIDEAAEVPYQAYTKLITRLSQNNDAKKYILLTMNPTTKRHWTYSVYFEGRNPEDKKPLINPDSYATLQMNPIDNTDNLPPDYIEMLEGLPEQDRERFLYGRYSEALTGVIYGSQVKKAYEDKRISNVDIYDPELPVYAVLDVGWADSTAMWVVQYHKNRIALLHYAEDNHTSIIDFVTNYILFLQCKISGIYLPHDANHKWVGNGATIVEILNYFSLKIDEDKRFWTQVLPLLDVWQGINATRIIFSRMWFHEEKCSDGIEALKEYKYEFNESLGVYKNAPRHDWASHGADALRYVVQAYNYFKKPKEKQDRDPNKIHFDDVVMERNKYYE